MSSLLIFEKPKQARTVCKAFKSKDNKTHIVIEPNEFFPNGAIAVWCVGHILRSLKPAQYREEYKAWDMNHLPIIISSSEFKLEVEPSKRSVFNEIRKFVNDPKIKEIYHYADAGLEGQVIVDEVLEFIKNRKPVKRVWASSLTPSATYKALKSVQSNNNYKNVYAAGKARQISDWTIGMNTSRCVSILAGKAGVPDSVFGLGRCKTPLTSIVYQREVEIETFKKKPYWDVYATFNSQKGTYQGKWFRDTEEHIWEKEKSEELISFCEGKPSRILSVEKTEKETPPPQFFNLTDLQSEANKKYKYSPDNVLAIAQELYEQSYISYPRADPRVVSTEEAKEFPHILSRLGAVEAFNSLIKDDMRNISNDKRFVNNNLVDDHYAIIPTDVVVDPGKLSKDQKNIYEMIVHSFIAAHYPPAVYDHTKIITIVDELFTFKTSGKILKQLGWKEVYGKGMVESPEEDTDEASQELPDVVEDESVSIYHFDLKEGETKPPSRFTQGQLVKIMERAGTYVPKSNRSDYSIDELSLGTVATRAGIIKEIVGQYISIKKNLVYIEPKGRLLMEAIGMDNWLATPLTTGRMEKFLEDIQKGKQSPELYLEGTNKLVTQFIEKLKVESTSWDFSNLIQQQQKKSEIGPCRICGKPVVDKGKFYGCSAYKETKCRFTFPKVKNEKTIPIAEVRKFLQKGQTSIMKGFKGKKGPFDASIVWDDKELREKFTFEGVGKKK